MTATETAHIALDDAGVARIGGTRSKVSQVVIDHEHHGLSPAEIHAQYPHLSLSQIHAALSYYYDHRAEIDEQIRAADEYVRQMRASTPESPFVKRMRDAGKIP